MFPSESTANGHIAASSATSKIREQLERIEEVVKKDLDQQTSEAKSILESRGACTPTTNLSVKIVFQTPAMYFIESLVGALIVLAVGSRIPLLRMRTSRLARTSEEPAM